jgi:hypothetical protein
MRHAPAAAILAALAALLGPAAAQAPPADPPPMKAEDTPQTTPQTPPSQRPPREMQHPVGPERQVQQQSEPQPPAQHPAARGEASQPQPPASAQRQDAPAGAPLGSAQQQRDGHEAAQTRSGIGGKQEPSASTPAQNDGPVLADGKLNVPGAPADSQTVPSKFSQRNADLDTLPIMAQPLPLTAEQKQKLLADIRSANAPARKLDPKLTEALPATTPLQELPPSAKAMGVGNLKYLRAGDRVWLVTPENRIVVGEIRGQ